MSDEQCGADPFENGYDQKLSEKEYRERIKYLMRCHDDFADEIERLRAREARLREALEKIAENEWVGGIGEAELYEGWREVAKKRGDIARAALGEEEK